MKAIIRGYHILAALIGFGILAGTLPLVFGGPVSEIRAQIFLAAIIITGTAAAVFWLRGLSRLKIARLISENPILHINTAVISEISDETEQVSDAGNIEVIVSYFGILMGEKIIKFNQDGIRLRAVEIGADYISFTYGTQKRIQKIRLLRPAIEPAELDKIAEKFRYETGVMPVFVRQRP